MKNKIQITSRALSMAFMSMCWAVPLVTVYFVMFSDNNPLVLSSLDITASWGTYHTLSADTAVPNISAFSLPHRLLLLLVECIPLTITVLIFQKLSKLFVLYAKDSLFEWENIKLIRNIGMLMLVGELLQLIYQPLNSLVLSFNNSVGERYIALSFGTNNISTIVTALVILVAAWIVGEAQKLQDEAKLTV